MRGNRCTNLKKTLVLIGLIVSGISVLRQTANAGPLEDAYAAYERQEFSTAIAMYQKLAAQNNSTAQYLLGGMYNYGQGVPQDYNEALKWYRLAAEQGNMRAQHAIGQMYQMAYAVPQDHKEALKWYRLAAELGYKFAQNNLGFMYQYGNGVPQNFVRAHMWYNLAAAAKDDQAISNRDRLASQMTPVQIAQAQEMATKCFASKFKDCD